MDSLGESKNRLASHGAVLIVHFFEDIKDHRIVCYFQLLGNIRRQSLFCIHRFLQPGHEQG